MRVRDLAERLGAELRGDGSVDIHGVASPATATPLDVAFIESGKYAESVLSSKAGAVLLGATIASEVSSDKPLLISRDPRLAFARAASILRMEAAGTPGVHASAVVDPSADVATSATVGPLVFIGPNVKIGARTKIGAGCMLLGETVIGADCELVARVTVYPKTRIGDRVIVHAGAVLGGDGFGFVRDSETGQYEKFPQIGSLEIGSDVEIGANATVDRGALEATVIGDGVKLDNMVHVGHNARLGENVVIAAQTGISGSSVIERNVLMGGQVGIADHVRIEEGAILGAQCGVPSKKVIRGKGVVFWGTPARPIAEYLKELAVVSRLVRKKSKE